MKRIIALLVLGLFSSGKFLAQEEEIRNPPSFSKIIVSPLIDLVLIKGDKEFVRIVADNVSLEKINTKNSGKTLKIFLDNARMGTNNQKMVDTENPNVIFSRSKYAGSKVKVYLTYKSLERLEVRGDGSVLCQAKLGSKKLKIKLMGEIEATFASIDVNRFVLSSFGENDIYVGGGAADLQIYRVFGEGQINTTNVNSELAKVNVFGAGEIRISTDNALKLKTFGESRIYYSGNPKVTKSLILGDVTIRSI